MVWWIAYQKRCFRTTTDSAHTLPVAPNLLAQDFSADAPGKVWLTDITYVRTDEGRLYLAGVKDVFTQELVGYAMSKRMTHELTLEALNRAVRYARPEPGLLHHSDRGSQYCASRYRERLDALGMQVSMSRRGNCYDNAPMESFWGSLKNELLYQRRFATRAQARLRRKEKALAETTALLVLQKKLDAIFHPDGGEDT